MLYTGDCLGVLNLSTDSSSRPTRQMSVGIGEYPIGLKTLTALRFTSARVVALEDNVEQVSVVDATDGDVSG